MTGVTDNPIVRGEVGVEVFVEFDSGTAVAVGFAGSFGVDITSPTAVGVGVRADAGVGIGIAVDESFEDATAVPLLGADAVADDCACIGEFVAVAGSLEGVGCGMVVISGLSPSAQAANTATQIIIQLTNIQTDA